MSDTTDPPAEPPRAAIETPDPRPLESLDFGASELRYNRFMRPIYAKALAHLRLPPGGTGLDAGCGPGGLFELMAEQAGPPARLIGIDGSGPHVEQARALAAGLSLPVTLLQADMRRRLPLDDGEVDWTWCADVLWGSYFPDPLPTVRELARVTRPGGVVAVFFADLFRGKFLPGHGRLECRANLASDLQWQRERGREVAGSAETPQENANAWLRQAGLVGVEVETFSLSYRQPLASEVIDYVRDYIFAELYEPGLRAMGQQLGVGEQGMALWRRLSDPADERYLLNDPDYHCSQQGVLAWGRVPHAR